MRILIVEDDVDFLSNCIAEIEKDYVVDVAYTASDGCYKSEITDYDVIVVDGGLPSGDGNLFCKTVRDANIASPILYIDAQENPESRVKSLKDGANVYFPKSASTQELKAQIKALAKLRHSFSVKDLVVLAAGALKINLGLQTVTLDGINISMRKKEFNILEYLLLNRGRVVSKEELLDHIWEEGILVKSNSLEVHMRNIRSKLERPASIKVISTVRGFGYRID